ncbi:MAG: UDP-N-acetyl-D-glucosamine dehydrogenase, partial [Frankiaceae bacterium]|nr:UDP-N-acetyl-D-glucosamine dehydrogenase [Frankiaceae bacterium]
MATLSDEHCEMSRSHIQSSEAGAGRGEVSDMAARAHDLVAGTDIVLSTDVVVIGLGASGLASVSAAAASGLSVAGLDVSASVVDGLNGGKSHVASLSGEDIAVLLSAGFRATKDEAVLELARNVIICVPTPLSEHGTPDLSAVLAAGRAIARHLHPGMLVILESTTYPGTTEAVLAPILEESGLRAGIDFSLACSPERNDAGNPEFGVHNTPKVVGGYSPACTDRTAKFFGRFVETVVQAR